MPMSVNCRLYRDGKCMHQAAPRAFFGAAACLLERQSDPRIQACALQAPLPRPVNPIPQPEPHRGF